MQMLTNYEMLLLLSSLELGEDATAIVGLQGRVKVVLMIQMM